VVSALALAPLFAADLARSVDPGRVASHGLACALWASEVALALGHQPSTHLITAALMHDVGMLLLDRFAPDDYAAALEHSRREGRHPADVEQVDLGLTHARAGALLCAKWMLPPQVTELVAGHHALDDGATTDGRLLAVADHLAACHGHATLLGSPPRPLGPATLVTLGLDAATLDTLGTMAPLVEAQVRAILVAAS
jgi:putative nucleotidyltransferase with HDIG domain